jgi:hypothetical protein
MSAIQSLEYRICMKNVLHVDPKMCEIAVVWTLVVFHLCVSFCE